MKFISVLLVSLFTMVPSVFAGPRYNLFDMTTSEARNLLEEKGAVLFNTKASNPSVFERVVKSSFFCQQGEVTEVFWGKTLDSGPSKDRIGHTCEDYHGGQH